MTLTAPPKRFVSHFLVLLLVGFSLLRGPAEAQEAIGSSRPLSALIKDWTITLDQMDKRLEKGEPDNTTLDEWRAQINALRLEAQTASDAAAPEVKLIQDELAALGPAPTEGQPPESPAVANKRKAISDNLSLTEGAIKETELILARSDRILGQLNTLRRDRFKEKLLSRGQSPLNPAIWKKAFTELANHFQVTGDALQSWARQEGQAQLAPQLAVRLSLGLVAAFILVWPLRIWLLRRFGYLAVEGEPTHAQRLQTALFTGFIRSLLPSAAAIAMYLALPSGNWLPDSVRSIAWVLLVALVFVFFVAAFCGAALAPFESDWRIVPINDASARQVSGVITGLAIVFAIDQVLEEAINQFGASLELIIVHKFLVGLAIAGLLLILLRNAHWQTSAVDEAQQASRPGWQQLRFFLRALTLAIPLSALLGYVALSRVLATQFVLTAGLYVAIVLLRKLGAEFVTHLLSANSSLGLRIRRGLSLSEEGAEMLCFWTNEAVGAAIFLLGFIVLLLLWGAGGQDISSWLYNAFFGFKVGNITLSLSDVLTGILMFAALLTGTRLLQRALEHRIFPRTRLDVGMRHSIRSAVGYLGFILAAVVAIDTVGVDLSQLAIIAGALSVGIGFGLQNIVNNFVSGIILLVERPIKVGDWVVVGEHQGYVRKISVRATEISTFDRASVFIPNSNLIASPVMNRTYADKVGRVVLPIALAHGTDTTQVKERLLAIAAEHRGIAKNPAPCVFLNNLGETAIHLELIAFVLDVDKVKSIGSDLYFDIDAFFRKEGIQMSNPHREVELKLKPELMDQLTRGWTAPNPNPKAVLPSKP